MTTVACPDCGAPLTGGGRCASCGLPLTGPVAARLWEVDQELAGLAARRATLAVERDRLLHELRGAAPVAPAAPARPAVEWTPRRVQNVLLSLGALLLAIAALVFTVVAWGRLGIGGRAAVLVTVTAIAAAVPALFLRRRLTATAEAVAAIAVALGVVDVLALRLAHVAEVDELDAHVYWAAGLALLAALVAAYAHALPVLTPRIAAAVLVQLPGPALATGASGPAAFALLVGGTAVVDLLLWRWLRSPHAAVGQVLAVGGTASWVLAAVAGSGAAFGEDDRLGAVALAGLAVVAAAAAVLVLPERRRAPAVAAATMAAAGTAVALVWPELDDARPVAIAVAGLIAATVGPAVTTRWRAGVLAGAAAVAGIGVLTVLGEWQNSLLLPLSWLGNVWPAGDAVLPADVATTVTLPDTRAAAAVAALTAGSVTVGLLAAGRRQLAGAAGAALAVIALLVVPFDLELSFAGAVAVTTTVSVVVLALPAWRRLDDRTALVVGAVGAVLATRAAIWSLGDRDATLVVLAVLALAALAALTRPALAAPAAGVAGLLGAAEVAAAGAAADLHADQVGALLVATAAALVLAAELPRRPARTWTGLLGAAAVSGAVGYGLAATDRGWLSWTLAGGGVVALAVAARRPSRRWVAIVGAALLTGSSWVRLYDAGVTHPEPYAVPPALLALALGWLRRRSAPDTPSFSAYGPGLGGLLLPSLVVAVAEEALLRPALLGLTALAVVVVGARDRLRAPIVLGGGTLLVLAVDQVAPYAADLPRWVLPAVAGVALVAVGATYEQRRRDVSRLRAGFFRFT